MWPLSFVGEVGKTKLFCLLKRCSVPSEWLSFNATKIRSARTRSGTWSLSGAPTYCQIVHVMNSFNPKNRESFVAAAIYLTTQTVAERYPGKRDSPCQVPGSRYRDTPSFQTNRRKRAERTTRVSLRMFAVHLLFYRGNIPVYLPSPPRLLPLKEKVRNAELEGFVMKGTNSDN